MDKAETERLEAWRRELPEFYQRWSGFKIDDKLRLVIFTRAFDVWPLHRQQIIELTLLSHIELTAEVPLFALDAAVTYLLESPHATFRPSIGEMLEVATIGIENALRYIRGREGSIAPIARNRETTKSAVDYALRAGRRLVGQPDRDPKRSKLLTPRYALAMTETLGLEEGTRDPLRAISKDALLQIAGELEESGGSD